jgi:4-amino-4-deoxy-L-arabinose transferase-like glycosyltransferase
MGKYTKWEVSRLLVLWCLSLAINLLSISYTGLHPLQGDQISYESIGAEIASGNSSGSSYQAPLYQFFVAGVYTVSGRDTQNIRTIQAILAAFSVVLIYIITRRLYDIRTANIAGLMAVCAFDLILYSGLVLSETLFVFLLLIGLICYDSIEKAAFQNKTKVSILTGLIFGLASLVKSQFVLFPPLLMLLRIVGGSGQRMRIIKIFLIIGCTMVLVILPWTVRNFIVHNEFIPITTNGGEVFWQGNNPDATGGDISHLPQFENHYIVKMDPVESNKIGYKLGFEWIQSNPIDCIKLYMKKLALYWTYIRDYQYDDIWGPYLGVQTSNIAPTAYNASIIILAFLGFAAAIRKRNMHYLILIIAYFSLIHMVFLSGVRYRIAILPVLIIFAAGGVSFIQSIIRSRSKSNSEIRHLAPTIIVGLTLTFLTMIATVYDIYQKIGGGKISETFNKIKMLLFN